MQVGQESLVEEMVELEHLIRPVEERCVFCDGVEG